MFESTKSARRAITGANDLYYFDKMQTSDQAQNMIGQLTQEAYESYGDGYIYSWYDCQFHMQNN